MPPRVAMELLKLTHLAPYLAHRWGSPEILAPFSFLSLCLQQNLLSPHLLPYACSPCLKKAPPFLYLPIIKT